MFIINSKSINVTDFSVQERLLKELKAVEIHSQTSASSEVLSSNKNNHPTESEHATCCVDLEKEPENIYDEKTVGTNMVAQDVNVRGDETHFEQPLTTSQQSVNNQNDFVAQLKEFVRSEDIFEAPLVNEKLTPPSMNMEIPNHVSNICLEITSNWGHPSRVGLTEIQLLQKNGKRLKFNQYKCVQVEGALEEKWNVYNLFNGKFKVCQLNVN